MFNKVALLLASLIVGGLSFNCRADANAYFKAGPLELNIPFKTADVVYLFNGLAKDPTKRSLVGGETPVATLWEKVSATAGVVTTAAAEGVPFLGVDIATGNLLDRIVSLGPIRVGGWGAYSFRDDEAMAGLKCSLQLWQ